MFAGASVGSRSQWNEFVQAVAENKAEPLKQFIAQNQRSGEILERVRDKDGRSLLHVAAFEGSGDAMTVLVRCPRLLSKLNKTDSSRRTPLHLSAAIGDEKCVRSLANAGAVLDPQDEWGCTPLHLAIKFEQLDAAKALLELGADPSREDLKGDNAVDMASATQDGQVSAMLISFEPAAKKSTSWKCLLPMWGNRRRRNYEDTIAAAKEREDSGLPPPPRGRLPVAQRLAGNTEHSSPSREPPVKFTGMTEEDAEFAHEGYPPPPPLEGREECPDDAMAAAEGGPLSMAIAEAARAHYAAPPVGASADGARHPSPHPADVSSAGQGRAGGGITGPGGATQTAKSARPAELFESEPRIEWHGLEAVYVTGEATSAEPAASIAAGGDGSSGGGLVSWLTEKVASAGTAVASPLTAPTAQGQHRSAANLNSDTEDDDESSQDPESDPESAADGETDEDEGRAGADACDPFRFHFLFDESAPRLGFEVAWQRQGEDDVEPSVGAVQDVGEAARRGVKAGDEIAICNGVETEGKVRGELIPLLKQRPLLMKVDRMIRLVDRRVSCVAVVASIAVGVADLGVKLSHAGNFPALAAVRPGSAAEAAGLLAGDAVVSINGQSLLKADTLEVKAALQKRPLELTLWRLPLGTQQWPQSFETWEATSHSLTTVDLRMT